MIKMVATDLDGTLLRSDKTISKRTLQAIEKLYLNGISFVIATARPKKSVQGTLMYDLDENYAIYCNGAEIYNSEALIYSRYLESAFVQDYVNWLNEAYPGINLAVVVDGIKHTNFDISIMDNWTPPYKLVDFSNLEFNLVTKVLIDLRFVSNLQPLYERLPDSCNMLVTDNGLLGHVAHSEVSKLNAIKHIAKVLEISLDDVMVFGDDYNDWDMIKKCGIGVAMGNAPTDIKNSADIIAAGNDEDGVALELEKLLEIS